MALLETETPTLEIDEHQATNGRLFFAPKPDLFLPTQEQVDEAVCTASLELDESLLAFGGMRRSRDAFRNILDSVPEERVHKAALMIASIFEGHINRGVFFLARTNVYFMGADESRNPGTNWLHRAREDNTYAIFTPPAEPYALDTLVQQSVLSDEAKLIDDTLTHAQHVKERQVRLSQERARQEHKVWKDSLGLGKTGIKRDIPGWMKMEFPTAPKVVQGVLLSEAFRNFRTGEVTWSTNPHY